MTTTDFEHFQEALDSLRESCEREIYETKQQIIQLQHSLEDNTSNIEKLLKINQQEQKKKLISQKYDVTIAEFESGLASLQVATYLPAAKGCTCAG